MPSSHPTPPQCHWFSLLAAVLDPRSRPRLSEKTGKLLGTAPVDVKGKVEGKK